MQLIMRLGIPIACMLTTVITLRYYHDRGLLAARRFAIIMSVGLSLTISSYYFLGIIDIITIGLFGLGVWIAFLNFIISYPAAWYFYKHFVEPHE